MELRPQMLNRFSLRQTLGAVAVTAFIAAIVRRIRIDNAAAFAFLLAPSLAYISLRSSGIVFRPCQWSARRPGLTLGITSIAALLLGLATEIRMSIAVLPVAALWALQLAVATLIEDIVSRYTTKGEPDSTRRCDGSGGAIVAGFSGFCFLLILCLSAYGTNHHVIGKGTAFGRYWMLVGSGSTTEFQWQEGYSDIPWVWQDGIGRAVPATRHRDWKFLGLERYRVGKIEKLRVPYWLPWIMFLISPVAWGIGQLPTRRSGRVAE